MTSTLTFSEAHPTTLPRGYVLFLHAFPLSSRMWDDQIEAVAKEGFYAIAPNVFGVEGSEPRDEWTFQEYIREVVAILDQKNIEQVSVVGLSMGGYQSFTFAKHFSNRIKSLVFCDTRSEADTKEAKAARFEFIEALKKKGSKEASKRMLPMFFAEKTYKDNPQLVQHVKAQIESKDPKAIQNQLFALASRQDSTAALKTLNMPTLFLVGTEDRLTPPDLAESMHKKVKGSELCRIVSCGHVSNLENPTAFNEAVLTHLNKVWVSD